MRRHLAELRLVWISHIHADHHAGLASILAARQEV
jgi:ribonuclease BN (tRNA processing enzyme)